MRCQSVNGAKTSLISYEESITADSVAMYSVASAAMKRLVYWCRSKVKSNSLNIMWCVASAVVLW